jgi:hypothetical protein
MKAKLSNIEAVLASIEAGEFCDCGHYYCPMPLPDGYRFPSGARLWRDGRYAGPPRLFNILAAIPENYRPEPVASADRYPQPESNADRRMCAAIS